jgi:hypothetical protein
VRLAEGAQYPLVVDRHGAGHRGLGNRVCGKAGQPAGWLSLRRRTFARTNGDQAMAEKRILIIEDEEDVREFLKVTLLSAGYSVDAAATAAEANRHLDAVFYTLVIADWRLPDGDGTELADRAFGLRAKTLILSGYLLSLPPEVADRHEPIMKPIRSFELVAAVQRKIGNPGLLHLNRPTTTRSIGILPKRRRDPPHFALPPLTPPENARMTRSRRPHRPHGSGDERARVV